ncbi:MAG: hypothetical protein J6Z14_13145, partial [Prevotella sp.]|nr:hypothetical protein [Prevotella sp.]
DDDELGTLTPTPDPDDPTKATLTGELDELDPEEDIEFHLHSASYDYSRQSGVLLSKDGENSIEEKFDYALCTVEAGSDKIKTSVVKDPDGDEYYLVTIEGGITLESQQAIVKFTLVDKADATTPMNVTRLEVDDHYGIIFVEPVSPTNALYVAVNSDGVELDYHLKAVTAKGDVYTYDCSDVTFLCGKYYEVKVQMTKQQPATIDLSKLSKPYIAVNGDVLTGTLPEDVNVKISITDGATVTLQGATIAGWDHENYDWAGLTCEGDATIVLKDVNSVRGFYFFQPGISVPVGKTLTIRGDGTLNVQSNNSLHPNEYVYGPGIGGRINNNCGNIRIESGTVNAIGHNKSPGIGSSKEHICGNITITGGTVTATGGDYAAGIGAGEGFSARCGNITITGGTVTAKGGQEAAGIGCGLNSHCGNITISNSASVTATKGDTSPYSVGFGYNDVNGTPTCGTITIGDTQYYDGTNKTWASETLENALKAATFTWPAP